MRYLCLQLPEWPLQELAARSDLDLSQPLALIASPDSEESRTADPDAQRDLRWFRQAFPSAARSPLVIAANGAARGMGIRTGMPQAEARSLAAPVTGSRNQDGNAAEPRPASPLQTAEWNPEQIRATLINIAELARPYSPRITPDTQPAPDCLLLDITGCGALYGTESALAEHLMAACRQAGWITRCALSESPSAAWAFAHAASVTSRPGKPRSRLAEWGAPLTIIPSGQAVLAAEQLPAELLRLPPDDVHLLGQLGIRQIRQLLRIPREELPSRLTGETIIRLRQFCGEEDEHLESLPEQDPVEAVWASEFPVETIEEFHTLLEFLVGRILGESHRRRLSVTEVGLSWKTIHNELNGDRLRLVRPVNDEDRLTELLKLRFHTFPGSEPLNAVRMEAVTAAMPRSVQGVLFGADDQGNLADELALLTERLTGRLGVRSVARPEARSTHRPEAAGVWVPLADETRRDRRALESLVTPNVTNTDSPEVPPPEIHRPLALQAVPSEIRHHGESVPTTLFYERTTYQHARTSGPERLRTAWWEDVTVHRDYYVWDAREGPRFWIYRDHNERRWFLHGIFL